MMKHKHALYPMIVSLIAFVCFAVVLVLFASTVQPLWGRLLLLIVPALVLGVVAWLAAKGKLGKSATAIWTTVLTVVLLLLSAFYVVMLYAWTATTTTTDVRYYSRAYHQIDDRDGVEDVFPASVPADAEEVSFIYHPQFLQGGEVFELSYTTTDEKLTQWKRMLREEAEWIGTNKEWEKDNGWFCDEDDGVLYQLSWDGGFYHGEICYVLINEETGCIKFYYSHW